jgi:hypothetical protein
MSQHLSATGVADPEGENQREGYDARAQAHYRDSLVGVARATKEELRITMGCISLVYLEKSPAALFRTSGLGAPLRFRRQKARFLPAAPEEI